MSKGNKVFRKVMKGIASTSAAPLTPAEERRLKDQEAHMARVKAQGDQERARLQREEELAEDYKRREAERRRRKTD
jgi:hypothetical protein